jgi:hypothetical protein
MVLSPTVLALKYGSLSLARFRFLVLSVKLARSILLVLRGVWPARSLGSQAFRRRQPVQ